MAVDFREMYLNDSKFKEFKTAVPGIQVLFSDTSAMCFHGKKKKHTWYYSFKSKSAMMLYIDKAIKAQYDELELKKQQKKEKAELAIVNRANVQVGDIYYTSWGYDQTNVEFFQIVSKPTAARVIIRAISMNMEETGFMSASCTPVKDAFVSGEKKCSINYNGDITNAGQQPSAKAIGFSCVTSDNYDHTAYKCEDGKSYRKSWYA